MLGELAVGNMDRIKMAQRWEEIEAQLATLMRRREQLPAAEYQRRYDELLRERGRLELLIEMDWETERMPNLPVAPQGPTGRAFAGA